MMREFVGRPVSPGYGRGLAFVYRGAQGLFASAASVPSSAPATELRRFEHALEAARHELQGLQARIEEQLWAGATEVGGIFRAHLLMLEDATLRKAILHKIEAGSAAERAVVEAILEVESILRASTDPYLRERALDVHDVGARLLRQLADRTHHPLAALPPGTVVVADHLFPSDTIFLDEANVSALVTEHGGDNSHTAILARSLGIPAVTNVSDIVASCRDGDDLAVDGQRGSVVLWPTGDQEKDHSLRSRRYKASVNIARRIVDEAPITRDGVRVRLLANAARTEDARDILALGGEGIGLLRTEFLYLSRDGWATEDEQVAAYREIARDLGERPIVVRLLDLGPDKVLPVGDELPVGDGAARARGIHYLLRHAEILRVQLRAILRAAEHADLRILLPMVVGIEEIEAVGSMLTSIREELDREGHHARVVPVGAMIETMPAVLMAPEIVHAVDFVSVGSNDLLRFLFAEGRELAHEKARKTPFEPSLLRAIHRVVEGAGAAAKPVSLCGELAGEPAFTSILIGLGFRELSMSPKRLAEVRYNVRRLEATRCAEFAAEVLRLPTSAAVRDAVLRHPDPWQRLIDRDESPDRATEARGS